MLRISFSGESEKQKFEAKRQVNEALSEVYDLLGYQGGINEIAPVQASEWQRLMRARDRLKKIKFPEAMADVIFSQGKISERLGDNKSALWWYEKGSILFPDRVSHFARGAGCCALQEGHLDEAIFFSNLAAAHDPNDSSLQTNVAIAFLIGGQIKDAYAQIVRTYWRWPQFGPARIETITYRCLNEELSPPTTYAEYLKILDQIDPDLATIHVRVRAAIASDPSLLDLARGDEDDELLLDAVQIAAGEGELDTGVLMQRLNIKYKRASRLIDSLIDKGVVG